MNAETRNSRILLLEDSPLDAELIEEHLRRAGLLHRIERVQTRGDFTTALQEPFDLIIADYVLPSFDGLAALDIAMRDAPGVPFILVSGTLDEETATEAMRRGATDFVTKQRLKRLPAAVLRAAAELAERRARQKAEDALRNSEESYRLATRATRLGVWRYDFRTGEASLDPMALAIFGLSEKPDGVQPILDRILPLDLATLAASFEAACDPMLKGEIDTEYRIKLRGDGIRWISVFGAVHFAEVNGAEIAEYALGTLQDITERKAADEKIQFLMREVNHRSKNLLSVVQSIARQTANTSSPGDFMQRFSQRLQGLAASHDLLVGNDWQGVSVGDLVTAQLSHFHDALGRLSIDGPEILLTAAAAQSLGIALHELGTNAAKYGALSNDAGTVSLSWDVTEGSSPHFHVRWTEKDGPPLPEPGSPGLGTRIITHLTERAFHGTVDLHYGEHGLTWSLTAPLDRVVET